MISIFKAPSPIDTELDTSELFPKIEPWPNFVRADTLLDEISSTVKRFAILPLHADTALALWITFTWFIDSVDVAPLLSLCSPEQRCGKTTVLAILQKLVKNPLAASNITPAALFRSIECFKPTILIDEADDSRGVLIRTVLNSGHTRDTAFVIRAVGDNHAPKQFSTWGAKAIASIGGLPNTLQDRSIIISLRRKLPHEKIERLRHSNGDVFKTLQRKLLRFSNDHAGIIRNSRPLFPEKINMSDRALDNWEPLLAIAELAGKLWINKVYQAVDVLSGREKDVLPIGIELLKDIQRVFEDKGLLKIHTVNLINYLCENKEDPWSTYNKNGQNKKITSRQLGVILKCYSIQSKLMRIGKEVTRGFSKDQFEDSWKCYLSSSDTTESICDTFQTNVTENCNVTDKDNRMLHLVSSFIHKSY